MTKPSPELVALFEPVLAWLDAGGDDQIKFNMSDLFESENVIGEQPVDYAGNLCGTTCCIAGAIGVFNPDLDWTGLMGSSSMSLSSRAVHADTTLVRNYGMDPEDCTKLFYKFPSSNITPEQAAIVVRNWIKTGEVDWGIIF